MKKDIFKITKTSCLLSAALILVLGAGCSAGRSPLVEPPESALPEETAKMFAADGEGVRVWMDPETNCQYLLLYNSSTTPRLAAEEGEARVLCSSLVPLMDPRAEVPDPTMSDWVLTPPAK